MTTKQGYQDPRYYAGMKVLAPTAYTGELTHYTTTGDAERMATIQAGGKMAEDPAFTATFDDGEYGLYWWIKAGRPAGKRK
jgi:hypothetical protein